ncbi:hypothetical protein DIPPA_35226 [Diplonema papillatum]|nr:hypothetical protein DIPPA_35226 [Diplonema papillatum]
MSSVTLRVEGAEGSSVVSAEDLLRKVAESASIDAAAVLSEEHRVSCAKKAREEFFRLASASGTFQFETTCGSLTGRTGRRYCG